jgi:hypothetical protein
MQVVSSSVCESHEHLKVSEELFRSSTIQIGDKVYCGEHFAFGNCPRCQSTLMFSLGMVEA